MSDDFDEARLRHVCDHFNASLRDLPLRRNEVVFAVAGDEPLRLLQHEAGEQLRRDGLSSFARKVERHPIPLRHVLVVLIGIEPMMFTLPIDESRAEPEPEPVEDEPGPRGVAAWMSIGAALGRVEP